MRDLVIVPPVRVSAIGFPVDCNALKIWATVAFGNAVLMAAKAPATCGVAIEVPARQPKVLEVLVTSEEWISELTLPLHRPVAAPPGAITSTIDAMLEKDEITSPLVEEPTVTAVETQPGVVTEFFEPLLPAAMTVATPAASR